jgi:predicted DNA-binding helix-hairpin-helix protein
MGSCLSDGSTGERVMVGVVSRPNTQEKLQILSTDAQYDLACACGTSQDEHRRRNRDGTWIYPVTLPDGGRSTLLKTLMSNVCTNDCTYCPLREQMDIRRCSLTPEETVRVFLDYYIRREVFGLFLSSGVIASPDVTMDRLTKVAGILRKKHRFKGYIHLKIIPGASDAAIEEALSVASAVSVNIETPGTKHLEKLSKKKQYIRDIIEPMKLISRLTARGSAYERVRQTTQFIVGAAAEKDAEIVKYMSGLYDRLHMHRVYFSAYQNLNLEFETQDLYNERRITSDDRYLTNRRTEECKTTSGGDLLMREHRLYQVDFLLRKYGFNASDIVFDGQGYLSLTSDPKEMWALNHLEMFPININTASKMSLLRIPGLGPLTVRRIIEQRKQAKFGRIEDVGKVGLRLRKAQKYLTF